MDVFILVGVLILYVVFFLCVSVWLFRGIDSDRDCRR